MNPKPFPSSLGLAALFLSAAGLGPALAQEPEVVDLSTPSSSLEMLAEDILDGTGSKTAACDVNGDGLKDLVLGASNAEPDELTRNNNGMVYVLYGERRAWQGLVDIAEAHDLVIYGQRSTDDLGTGVACDDLDGDGFDDMVLCAKWANRLREGKWYTGQAHIVWGRADFPPVIDLLDHPGTVIEGAFDEGALCYRPQIADIDGDGRPELILDDNRAFGPTAATRNGRVYVLRGRDLWPETIDLRLSSAADTVFIGAAHNDALGSNMTTGDLNRDGTADLVIGARQGDGPFDGCDRCGDIYVFYGRSAWPERIELEFEDPDVFLYGADPIDQAGANEGLFVADIDGDGTMSLLVGIRGGDGKNNDAPSSGELRVVEFTEDLLPIVDLENQSDHVVYGKDGLDQFSKSLFTRDYDADGSVDLVASCRGGDGADEGRSDAGEILAFSLGGPMAAELLVGEDEDLRIIGREPFDELALEEAPSDLNNDGIPEIVATSGLNRTDKVSSIWLLSPVDVDGDGFEQLEDNCPLIANPDQLDADGDRVGDACAGDWDGDGQADAEDCAPADPGGGTPGPVDDLGLEGGATTTLSWSAVSFAHEYDVARGLLSELGADDMGTCQNERDPDLGDTSFVDDELPLPGEGFFYLVRGRNLVCAEGGGWGTNAAGSPRNPPLGCP